MRTVLFVLAVLFASAQFGLMSVALAQAEPTKGQVTKIDEPAGKITLKHEAIKNLDMGAMSMVFRVTDPAMLKTVKVGDQVTFEADRINGAITVTNIKKIQ